MINYIWIWKQIKNGAGSPGNLEEVIIEIFVITTRGLEPVSAGELALLPGVQVVETAYRRVSARIEGDLARLLRLRTVDDVFLPVGEWDGLVPQRAALDRIRAESLRLELKAAVEAIAGLRDVGANISFSVSVNFVGRRNYSAEEIKTLVAEGVAGRYGWGYGDENRTSLNLRVFIEHERAWLGLRLSAHPLHDRLYKQAHISGSLKPPVAAAMLMLAEPHPAATVLDPFCGAGTIAIEAGLVGLVPLAFDHEASALAAAAENARLAGVSLRLGQVDARRLALGSGSVELLAANLPWGRQVPVSDPVGDFYRQVCAEIERVLVSGGRAVLLTNLPQLLSFERLTLHRQVEISLFGQAPSILVVN